MESADRLNEFMVSAYNGILRSEEQSLCNQGYHDISISEFHVLEAVCTLGENARMSDVASVLKKTQGTLTVAVDTLVKKGYLLRRKAANDKRSIVLVLTEKGAKAEGLHREYHANLVKAICENLNVQQVKALSDGLEIIANFIKGEMKNGD